MGYGKEFWRLPAADPASVPTRPGDTNAALPGSVNLDDVIERVRHALETNAMEILPVVKAHRYTATFGGDGLRLSPRRPEANAPESPWDSSDVFELWGQAQRDPALGWPLEESGAPHTPSPLRSVGAV